MPSKKKNRKISWKIWFLAAAVLMILLLALVLLFRHQPDTAPLEESKAEKVPPTGKVQKGLLQGKKEKQNQDETDYYKMAVNQNTISAYQEYINNYPSGTYVQEVENKIKELKEMPEDVRIVAAKASKGITVKKNEKGFWEADCDDGIIMVYIPAGQFIMGTDDGPDYEKPSHEVVLDAYWMGKYEVTFDQYEKFCNETSKEITDTADAGWGRGKRPVIHVSWHDANDYCKWLSAKTGLNFKLPTEAQWEKAAQGTRRQKYPWGDQKPTRDLANFGDEINKGKTFPVGSFPQGASPYGLMDMAGNVWEWCNDWYGSYSGKAQKNPTGPQSGHFRVIRGGCWFDSPNYQRCSNRYNAKPSYRGYITGFRLCMGN